VSGGGGLASSPPKPSKEVTKVEKLALALGVGAFFYPLLPIFIAQILDERKTIREREGLE
jgi:hypothetical protein